MAALAFILAAPMIAIWGFHRPEDAIRAEGAATGGKLVHREPPKGPRLGGDCGAMQQHLVPRTAVSRGQPIRLMAAYRQTLAAHMPPSVAAAPSKRATAPR